MSLPLQERKRPTNRVLASLVSLVAGVFRSPNFIPTQVMVRSEQCWRRLPVDLSSQGGGCGSVVRWRVFKCRCSIGGRSGLRVELPNGDVIHSRIANAMTTPRASIIGDNRPSNKVIASPSAHTALRDQHLPSLRPRNLRLPSPASGEVRDRRRAKYPESFASPVTTPADNAIGHPLPPSGRPAGGYRRGDGFVGRLVRRLKPAESRECKSLTGKIRPIILTPSHASAAARLSAKR
jgi:hypothetical protein